MVIPRHRLFSRPSKRRLFMKKKNGWVVFIKRHHLKPSGSNIFPCKQSSHIPLWLSQESFRVHFLLHDPEEQVQSPGPSFPSLHFLSQWYNSNDLILSDSWISKSILLSRLSRFAKEKFSTCMHLKSFLYTNRDLIFCPPNPGLLLFHPSPLQAQM